MDRLNPDDIHDAAYGGEEDDSDDRGAAARALGYWLGDEEQAL